MLFAIGPDKTQPKYDLGAMGALGLWVLGVWAPIQIQRNSFAFRSLSQTTAGCVTFGVLFGGIGRKGGPS